MSDTLPTPTLPPVSTNYQDYSDSDDEIMDNFGEGPDDHIPLGLGGDKGKQSEPASSTLEADLVSGGGGDKPKPSQEPEEPADNRSVETDSSELPEVLLRMAGYEDADAAIADGIGSVEALQAFVRGRGQLLAPKAGTSVPADFYKKPGENGQPGDDPLKPFELPEDKLEMLDPDLRDLVEGMNSHYQQQIASLRSAQSQEQQLSESAKFDETVRSLGTGWEEVFGGEPGDRLLQSSQADPIANAKLQQRITLFEDVQAVRKVNQERGFKPLSLEQEVQFALMQRYPDKFNQSISGTSRSRQGVTASRPTQRRTPPRTQSAKVLSDINAMLAKKGRPALDMGDGDDFDGEI